jgi:hypothetical protein
MAVPISELDGGKAIEVVVTEKLHKEDYATFVPPIEKSIGDNGKVRLLFEMRDFHGWELGAVWEDIKFATKHCRDINKIAMVGENTWEKWMAAICKPFTMSSIKYFDAGEEDAARQWLSGS